MFYIHKSACISPQHTFGTPVLEQQKVYDNNQMHAIEPVYEGVPPGQLRRMGKALRMGVGSGMSLLKHHVVDGIIIGTANGGIEDSICFLNQIEEYAEGRLTPTHFVQSTFNAIAGMMGLITKNKGYNATHVHRGAAFENVLIDAAMLLKENTSHQYLIGAVDEISVRNYRMESLAGWYKKEIIPSNEMFSHISAGMIPGEGAAMFLVSNQSEGAVAQMCAITSFFCKDETTLQAQFTSFLAANNIDVQEVDLLLSGYNADERFTHFYDMVEAAFASKSIARFKQLTGDFQTVSALAVWWAVQLLHQKEIPGFMLVTGNAAIIPKYILIYNNYRGEQHSFILLKRP